MRTSELFEFTLISIYVKKLERKKNLICLSGKIIFYQNIHYTLVPTLKI